MSEAKNQAPQEEQSAKIEYTVAKPFEWSREPKRKGDRVEMTRQEAEFLLVGGFLERRPTATKPVTTKEATK